MKVAFVTTDSSILRYDTFFTAVRSVVGTTEIFVLTPYEIKNLGRYLTLKRWDLRFDRIVFLLEPKILYEQRQSLLKCKYPVIMRFGYDHILQDTMMVKLLKQMPWMRWLGTNPLFARHLNEMGYDAYAAKNMSNLDNLPLNTGNKSDPTCFIYGNCAPDDGARMIKELSLKTVTMDPNADYQQSYQNISSGDIFIFWPAEEYYDPLPIVRAMARGAIVLSPDLGYHLCMHYGWQDNHNILFMSGIEHILETIEILATHKDIVLQISSAALEVSAYYSQRAVGQEIGSSLMMPMREINDYRQKIQLLGFRF